MWFSSLSILSLILHANAQFTTNGSYTPNMGVTCPAKFTRQSTGANFDLDPREAAFIAARKQSMPNAWKQWLGSAAQIGYQFDQLNLSKPENVPVIGMAVSGGSFRYVSFEVFCFSR